MRIKGNLYQTVNEIRKDFNHIEREFYNGKEGDFATAYKLMICSKRINEIIFNTPVSMRDVRMRMRDMELLLNYKLVLALGENRYEPNGISPKSLYEITEKVINKVMDEYHEQLVAESKVSKKGIIFSNTLEDGTTTEVYLEDMDRIVSKLYEENTKEL